MKLRIALGLLKIVALSFISFLALTISLFLFWRHFSNEVLIACMINPHSSVPRSVQENMATNYFHLNSAMYLQYPWFLFNIFTGKWGDLGVSPMLQISSVHLLLENTFPNNLFVIFTSLVTGLLIANRPHRAKNDGASAKNPCWKAIRISLLIFPVILVPTLLSFLFNFGSEYISHIQFFVPPAAFTGITLSTPTHITFVDSVVQRQWVPAFIYFENLVPSFISMAIVLALASYALRSPPEPGNAYSSEKNISVKPAKLSYLVALTIVSSWISQVIFLYRQGSGFYSQYFVHFNPYTEIWFLVYFVLLYGTLTIALTALFRFLGYINEIRITKRKSRGVGNYKPF